MTKEENANGDLISAADAIAQRRSVSLTSIVQKELESMILSGRVKSGERLNEQQLAKQLGVSRGPVREAVMALESAGLLESSANRGSFVREVSLDELLELYDIRGLLTGFACQLIAEQGTADQKRALRDIFVLMQESSEQEDLTNYYEHNIAFHNALLEFSGHKKITEIYMALAKQTHLSRLSVLARTGNMKESNAEHAKILDAIDRGDGKRARSAGELHALSGKRRLLSAIQQ